MLRLVEMEMNLLLCKCNAFCELKIKIISFVNSLQLSAIATANNGTANLIEIAIYKKFLNFTKNIVIFLNLFKF